MLLQLIAVLINFIPILLAIILHEVAHGYVAYKFGDDTALRAGRLSLNPLRHIELFGSIALPALLYYSGVGFVFGWAKPVPVNFTNLKSDKAMLLVSAAGIITNIVLALISAMFLSLVQPGIFSIFWANMVIYNIVLAVFNLLPIPPLDGSKILFGWIHKPWAQKYISSEQSGLMAVIVLIFVLPAIGRLLHIDLNLFGWYLINVSKFFISILV